MLSSDCYVPGCVPGSGAESSAACSAWEWRRNQDAIRHDRPLPSSHLPLIVAIVVTVVALFGFVLVIVEGTGT